MVRTTARDPHAGADPSTGEAQRAGPVDPDPGHLLPDRAMVRRVIDRLGLLRVTADLLATGGVFLCLTGTRLSEARLLLVAALIIVVVRGAAALRRSAHTAVGPTGGAVLARVLVTVGLAATRPAGTSVVDVRWWIVWLLCACAVLAELVVAPLARLAVPCVQNLPGIVVRNRPRLAAKWVFAANTAALTVLGVVWTTDPANPAIIMLVTVAQWLVLVVVAGDVVDRIWQRRRVEGRLIRAVTDYAPTFVVHWYAPTGSKHQLTMWLPYLERLGRPFMIIVRNPATFDEIVAETTRPVLVRRYGSELPPLVVPSLRSVLYVNTSPRNEPMLAFLEVQHVQLNHGDSDKAPSYRRAFRVYDKNFVAGQAAVDRFAKHGIDVSTSMFEIVGRPQVETITVATRPIGHQHTKTVLYAPTWYGYLDDSRYSSLMIGHRIVTGLLERNCTVIFRPHPWTGRTPRLAEEADRIDALLQRDAASSGRRHVCGATATHELSLTDCFNRADAMIADVSSVLSDFLYSEKPYALTSMEPARSAADIVAELPLARGGYLLPANEVDWPRIFDDLLTYDPKLVERRSLRAYYLGSFPADSYADGFVSAAMRYV